jgi:enoyl-CoA hydratase/carnithine racemase
MRYKHILYSKEFHLATVILNRPERHNTIAPSMLQQMTSAIADAVRDDEEHWRCSLSTKKMGSQKGRYIHGLKLH